MTLADVETGEIVAGRGMVKIGHVVVGDRARRDLGDMDALAESIASLGLLQPILLDSSKNLIAGFRRLEACKSLGWKIIDAKVASNLDDAVVALTAERDENTCRKEFTASELRAMGAAIEAIEAPKAAERQRAGGVVAPGPQGQPGRVRDKVAGALGTSPRNYGRIKAVGDAADDPTSPAHEVAQEQMAALDAGTTSVKRADEAVQRARRPRITVPMPLSHRLTKAMVAIADLRANKPSEIVASYDAEGHRGELGLIAQQLQGFGKSLEIAMSNTPIVKAV